MEEILLNLDDSFGAYHEFSKSLPSSLRGRASGLDEEVMERGIYHLNVDELSLVFRDPASMLLLTTRINQPQSGWTPGNSRD